MYEVFITFCYLIYSESFYLRYSRLFSDNLFRDFPSERHRNISSHLFRDFLFAVFGDSAIFDDLEIN